MVIASASFLPLSELEQNKSRMYFIALPTPHFISLNNSLGVSLAVSYLSVLSQCSLGDLKDICWINTWALCGPWKSPEYIARAKAVLNASLCHWVSSWPGRTWAAKTSFLWFPQTQKSPRCLTFRDYKIVVSCPPPPPPYPTETWSCPFTGSEIGVSCPEF